MSAGGEPIKSTAEVTKTGSSTTLFLVLIAYQARGGIRTRGVKIILEVIETKTVLLSDDFLARSNLSCELNLGLEEEGSSDTIVEVLSKSEVVDASFGWLLEVLDQGFQEVLEEVDFFMVEVEERRSSVGVGVVVVPLSLLQGSSALMLSGS